MCLQLREQPGGSLSLVSFEPTDICLMPSPDLNSFRAKTFLRCLLRSHLCITGLKLRDIWATRYGQFLFDELPRNSRLKKLILRFSFDLPVPTHITTLLPKLRSLEELSCSVSFQRTDALVDAVSALLRTTTCLSSLVFDASFHDNQREKTFLEALAANSTLKSLELRVCWTPDTARGPFGEYVRSNRLITNLTLLCDDVDREGLFLDETLVHNGTLSTLEIQKVCGGERTTRFLTRIIAECAALKKLTICEYIQATTALRELSLRVPRPQCARSAATLSCWTLLFQSISANTSIAVGLSRNISRASLQLDINEPNATGFVVALSEVISDNYNLVEVSLYSLDVDAEATRSWFTIMDTTRRNSGLVNRAVVFKQSCPLDWYTATALEKVSRHPALLKVLAEKEGIAACDVARMVRSRLCSVDGLHDFMRLSGVVKERVTCVPPIGDSSKQLADLHIDCWRVLRRYLSFDDVKRFAV
ncbi:hypothetical protein HPB52_024327 [Rhipicephalus sanguineus]|uniref:Nlr family card domain protein n=1 Tax=Rhipicephalus sanguineus TaxID=34632 RepID=A0A9D4TCJ6_RHISA|nr:hypothetical protein HPB52_024327 [Rhipicephalus sanguineus]